MTHHGAWCLYNDNHFLSQFYQYLSTNSIAKIIAKDLFSTHLAQTDGEENDISEFSVGSKRVQSPIKSVGELSFFQSFLIRAQQRSLRVSARPHRTSIHDLSAKFSFKTRNLKVENRLLRFLSFFENFGEKNRFR